MLKIISRILLAFIVTFLTLSGLLRIWELNSDTYEHDIAPYCEPKGLLGWGYECDVELMRERLTNTPLDNYTVNWSEVSSDAS